MTKAKRSLSDIQFADSLAERERIFRAVCLAALLSSYVDRAPTYLVEKAGMANDTFRLWRHLDIPRRSNVLEYLRDKNVYCADILDWINQQTQNGTHAETITGTVLVGVLKNRRRGERYDSTA